jgi:hypothetical protein
MRKYIFTESQIKKIVDSVILRERYSLNEVYDDTVYARKEIIALCSNDLLTDDILDFVMDGYADKDDYKFAQIIKKDFHLKIDPISHGKFVITH